MEMPCRRCDRVGGATSSSPVREVGRLETCPRPSEMDRTDCELQQGERKTEDNSYM